MEMLGIRKLDIEEIVKVLDMVRLGKELDDREIWIWREFLE
jgi:hypothetical protein